MHVRASVLALALALPGALRAQGGTGEGIRLYEAGQTAAARAAFEAALRADASDAQAAFWLGRLALEANDADRAAKHLERAVELQGSSSEFHMWLGRAYGRQAQRANVFKQAGLARKTKGAWDRSVQLDPSNLDARANLIDFYLNAPGVMGGGTDKALREAEAIAARDALRGHLERGRVFEHEKRWADAEREYLAAAKQRSERPTAQNRLITLYQNTAQWDRAFALAEETLQRFPGERSTWYVLGRLGAASGQKLDRAQEALERYLQGASPSRDEPTFAAARWRLGMIHEHRNDRAKARAEYETAVRLDPKFRPAADALKKLS